LPWKPRLFLESFESSASIVSAMGAVEKGKLSVRVLLDEYPYRLMEYARD
jgi:hypothetical protein